MADVNSIDWSKYASWEKIRTPSGGTYYIVPDTAYVYDPFASNLKGRPVLYLNPKPSLDAQSKAEQDQQDAVDRQKKALSPANQLLPIAGTVAGTVGAAKAVQMLTPPSAAEKLAETMQAQLANQTAQQGTTAAQGFMQGAGVSDATGAVPVGSAANGGVMMSDGSISTVPPAPVSAANGVPSVAAQVPGMPIENGFTLGNVMAAAAAAKGTYDTVKGLGRGGEGLRPGLTTAGAGIGQLVGGPIGAGIGAIGGNLVGYGLQGHGWKNDAALVGTLGPIGAGIAVARHLGFDPVHRTTGQIQADRWSDVGHPEMAGQVQDYFAGTGGEDSRDESKLTVDSIRNNPDNYHNIADWDNWTPASQNMFLSTMLSEGKVQEKKGGIYYDDARAQELADSIRKGQDLATRMNAKAA